MKSGVVFCAALLLVGCSDSRETQPPSSAVVSSSPQSENTRGRTISGSENIHWAVAVAGQPGVCWSDGVLRCAWEGRLRGVEGCADTTLLTWEEDKIVDVACVKAADVRVRPEEARQLQAGEVLSVGGYEFEGSMNPGLIVRRSDTAGFVMAPEETWGFNHTFFRPPYRALPKAEAFGEVPEWLLGQWAGHARGMQITPDGAVSVRVNAGPARTIMEFEGVLTQVDGGRANGKFELKVRAVKLLDTEEFPQGLQAGEMLKFGVVDGVAKMAGFELSFCDVEGALSAGKRVAPCGD